MEILELLRSRRSVRKYKPIPIPKQTIERLIEAASYAPSANNIQPWEFVAITEKPTLQRLADMTDYGKFIAEAPLCIVVFCRETKYYLEDGCAAVMNILTAAAGMGLGACWVAGDKKKYANEVRDLLGGSPEHRLIALLPIGYPDEEERLRKKRELKEVLHYERF